MLGKIMKMLLMLVMYGNYGFMRRFLCFLMILGIDFVRNLCIGVGRNGAKRGKISMILFSYGFSDLKTYTKVHNCYCLVHKMLGDCPV